MKNRLFINNVLIACFCLGLIVAGVLYFSHGKDQSSIRGAIKSVVLLNATSTSATSSAINVKYAKKVSLSLTDNIWKSGYGTTTFGVLGSIDGTNFFSFNKLIDNVANTNSQTLTRISSKSVSATTSDYLVSIRKPQLHEI